MSFPEIRLEVAKKSPLLLNKASVREKVMSFPEKAKKVEAKREEVAKKSPLLLNKASVREKVMSFPEKAKKVEAKREKRPVSVKKIYIYNISSYVHVYGSGGVQFLLNHVTSLRSVAQLATNNWTDYLDGIPQKYFYLSLVEYLIKRTVTVLDSVGNILPVPLSLPVADKPLVKGSTCLPLEILPRFY